VVLTGRYTSAGRGVVRLKGKMSGREFVREIAVDFPESIAQHDVLAPLWARSRIDNLMGQDYQGMQQGAMRPELKETITGLGLEFRLMTQFTSFVAVEEMIVTDGGQPRRIDVPVEVPEGVNRATTFGKEEPPSGTLRRIAAYSAGRMPIQTAQTYPVIPSATPMPKPSKTGGGAGPGGGGGGIATGRGGGIGGGNNKSMRSVRVAEADGEALKVNLSPEDQKRQLILSKLHPSLVAVVDRLQAKGTAPTDEAKFVRDGKADLQVWLTDKSPEALAELKQLGFEVILDPRTSKLVIGRLPIENLKKLAELKFVRYVVPQIARS